MTSNYQVSRTGFTVRDSETNHVLEVIYQDDTYHGVVVMPEQGERLPLAPWKKGENPFKDDRCFEGVQTGYPENGLWWFAIRPSMPFSKVLAEVESLNTDRGFFRRLVRSSGPKLQEVVQMATKSGYVFWDINDDLGKSCEEIMKSSKSVQMAYGYARRAAAASLYLQGIFPSDAYGHVQAFFNALQAQTGATVDFQKQAFLDSIEFMQTYSPLITSFFVKKTVSLAEGCEPQPVQMSDADFFKLVLDMAYSDQVESAPTGADSTGRAN